MATTQQTINILEGEQIHNEQAAALFASIADCIAAGNTERAATLAGIGQQAAEDAAGIHKGRLYALEIKSEAEAKKQAKPAQIIDIDDSKLAALKMALSYTRKAADYKDIELSPSESTPFYSALDALDNLAEQCHQRQLQRRA